MLPEPGIQDSRYVTPDQTVHPWVLLSDHSKQKTWQVLITLGREWIGLQEESLIQPLLKQVQLLASTSVYVTKVLWRDSTPSTSPF